MTIQKSRIYKKKHTQRRTMTLKTLIGLLNQILYHGAFLFFVNVAIADVYKTQGNEEFNKGDFLNAIQFYTQGIKVNCDNKELKAKLYNNRAIAHFKLGKMM